MAWKCSWKKNLSSYILIHDSVSPLRLIAIFQTACMKDFCRQGEAFSQVNNRLLWIFSLLMSATATSNLGDDNANFYIRLHLKLHRVLVKSFESLRALIYMDSSNARQWNGIKFDLPPEWDSVDVVLSAHSVNNKDDST